MSSIKLSLVILNSPAGDFQGNLDKTVYYTEKAASAGARIVLFPELNLTGYITTDEILTISRPFSDPALDRLVKLSSHLNITIMAGLAERSESGKIYASHLVFSPDGTVGKYRKLHTAPFEKKFYSAGNRIPVFHIENFCFGIQLCYDAHFPELSCVMALKGVDAVLIPHASPRGNCRGKYDSWLRHLTARAFDNGIYVAACNQTGNNTKGLTFPGISMLIGPDGQVIDSRTDGKEGVHLLTIDKETLNRVRSHKMKYFLSNRRNDLFKLA